MQLPWFQPARFAMRLSRLASDRISPLGSSAVPVEIKIHTQLRLVVGSAWGAITFADVKGYQDHLLADPDFSPDFDQLMDGRKITEWLLTVDEAEAATRRRFFSPSSKRAYIRPAPADSPIARILTAYCEMTKHLSHIRVFDDVPSALEWLGVGALPEINHSRTGG